MSNTTCNDDVHEIQVRGEGHSYNDDLYEQELRLYQEDHVGTRPNNVIALPTGNPRQKVRIVSSGEFANSWKPPDPLIYGVFQRRYIYAITGKAGTGKTAICLTLAAHVALGKPLGRRKVKQGRVLYLAGENPDDIRTRWVLLCEEMGVKPEKVPVDFIDGVFEIEDIRKAATARGPYALVIVDTSAAYFSGEDENSNVEAKEHAQALRKLTRLPGGPCVLVACHPPNSSDRLPRGGSAFLNEIDGNTYLKNNGDTVCIHQHEKFRGPPFEPVPFRLVEIESKKRHDADGLPVKSIMAVPLDKAPKGEEEEALEDRIMRALNTDGYKSLSQLAEKAGVPNPKSGGKSMVDRALKKLKDRGLAMKHPRGNWCLTPKGER